MLVVIWPIFALICLGFGLRRIGIFSAEFWSAAERLNYFVLFPALLISSLARAPLHDPTLLRLGLAAVLVLLIGTGLLYLTKTLRPMPASRFGPVLQGVLRFNTYLGMAILAALGGAAAIERAAVYLAIAVPTVNVLAILALSEKGAWRRPMVMVRQVALNPLVLGCIVGAFLAVTGIGLPFGSQQFFTLMAQGSLPLGLLSVGAALQPVASRRDFMALFATSFARLLLMPGLAAVCAGVMGLPPAETLVLVLFSAIPTAPTAYILTRQLGGDGPFMAGLITAQTLAALVTIPLVLGLAGLP